MDSLKRAIDLANNFTVQHAGITKDFYVVSTLECVKHQKKKGNLLIHVQGNWRREKIFDEQGKQIGSICIQTSPPTITQCNK